jgi:hypothetical protein
MKNKVVLTLLAVLLCSTAFAEIKLSKLFSAHMVLQREMPVPIWGTAYRVQAGEYYGEFPYDPVVYVRSRILALVEYINRLQER